MISCLKCLEMKYTVVYVDFLSLLGALDLVSDNFVSRSEKTLYRTMSVWSFWVIDTNRKYKQTALICHKFQNCAL